MDAIDVFSHAWLPTERTQEGGWGYKKISKKCMSLYCSTITIYYDSKKCIRIYVDHYVTTLYDFLLDCLVFS